MKTIHLSAINRSVSLKDYIYAVKLAKSNPTKVFKHGLTCWWQCTGQDIIEQFFDGMQDRINQAIPYNQR